MTLLNVIYVVLVSCIGVWLVCELIWGGSYWRNHLSPQNRDTSIDLGFNNTSMHGKWFWWKR